VINDVINSKALMVLFSDSEFYHLIVDLLFISISLGKDCTFHVEGYPMWQSFKLLEIKKYEKLLI